MVNDTCKKIEEIKSMIDKYLYTGQAEFYRGQAWGKITARLCLAFNMGAIGH